LGGFCEIGQSFQDCDQGCLVLLLLTPRSEAGRGSSIGGTLRSRLLYLDVRHRGFTK
jgi:hypothetical protein